MGRTALPRGLGRAAGALRWFVPALQAGGTVYTTINTPYGPETDTVFGPHADAFVEQCFNTVMSFGSRGIAPPLFDTGRLQPTPPPKLDSTFSETTDQFGGYFNHKTGEYGTGEITIGF